MDRYIVSYILRNSAYIFLSNNFIDFIAFFYYLVRGRRDAVLEVEWPEGVIPPPPADVIDILIREQEEDATVDLLTDTDSD